MCISYSGRCLLSNYYMADRDANRGECSGLSLEHNLVEENVLNSIQLEDEENLYI